ncbi:TolC family protein [Rhodopirellula sp. MGV]|uniref:TolC family protein n=1 Tax=Rhodopirellula sp. MGV TaxID=2023130 RepID=UPI000B97792E|nr:TolC family protein [Rhodopirellula sp. MGV]OYP33115.1 transporter [Rhodopirellula sp. MGV]PNY35154.1 TolC family protein [Rhodopirellula baltica]
MNRSLFHFAASVQLALAIVMATGCTPTQPFFVNESPDLKHYLDTATSIEYPDVDVQPMPEAIDSLPPLTVGNHDYQYWNLSLEECVSMALNNARFILANGGTSETQQNLAAQFISSQPGQFGSIYDVALQQTTTQSIPLTTDGAGNRLLSRGVQRANQIGGVEDALAEFDAVASGFIDLSTTDRPQNVGAGNSINPQISVAQNTTQQSAISKRLGTGGVATLRQQTIYTRNNSQISSFSRLYPSDYTALLEAQIQHPLARNRGTFVNRIPVMLASMNEDIAIATYEAQVRNLVRNVEVAYWDLYLSYRSVSTATIARDSAQATAQFTKLNLEKGNATIQELSQAVSQYWNQQRRLTAALNGSNLPGDDRFGVYGRERALRELIGLSPTDKRLIRPIDEPTLARVEFDWWESVAQALYLSPELREKKYRIKQGELELALAKNQVLPQVDLSFLYRWVGLGDTLGPPGRGDSFPANGSSALAELTSGDYQEAQVRLDISMPIGLRREHLRIRNAQMTLRIREDNLSDSERLLVSQLSDAVAKVASHYSMMQFAANEWQQSEQEVDARLLEYYKGFRDVNVVLQSQQRRAEAQISYYRALTEYNKSINYVDFLRGTLLANNGITLREGPWNTKAYCDALERARERAAGYQLEYGVTRPGVVRQGPVRDADGAVEVIGFSDNANANTNNELNFLAPGVDDVPEVNQNSLQELPSTGELLTPDPQMPRYVPVPDATNSIEDGSSAIDTLQPPSSVLVPNDAGQSGDQVIQPMSYETPSAIGSGVRSAAKSMKQADLVDPNGAPIPVRRKPIRVQ